MTSNRPARFHPSTLDDARGLLRCYMQDLGKDPALLRPALEDEYDEQLELWLTSHPENVPMYADEATAAWIALGMVAWMQMRASTREVCSLLGPSFAKRVERLAQSVADMAVWTGDWWWACAELRMYIEREISNATDGA